MVAGESVSLATFTAPNQRTNYPLLGSVGMSVSLSGGFIGLKCTSVCLPKKNQQLPAQ